MVLGCWVPLDLKHCKGISHIWLARESSEPSNAFLGKRSLLQGLSYSTGVRASACRCIAFLGAEASDTPGLQNTKGLDPRKILDSSRAFDPEVVETVSCRRCWALDVAAKRTPLL